MFSNDDQPSWTVEIILVTYQPHWGCLLRDERPLGKTFLMCYWMGQLWNVILKIVIIFNPNLLIGAFKNNILNLDLLSSSYSSFECRTLWNVAIMIYDFTLFSGSLIFYLLGETVVLKIMVDIKILWYHLTHWLPRPFSEISSWKPTTS